MTFEPVDIHSADAVLLIEELNRTLVSILGHDGTRHVNLGDFEQPNSVFIIGYDDGEPVCCAGIRQFDNESGEVKRVYARKNSKGYAAQLMKVLEAWASEQGYKKLILECREQNSHALDFYSQAGYQICEKYTPYENEADAVCMYIKL